MYKIALFQLGYETNSFMPGIVGFDGLCTGGWTKAEDIVKMFSGKRSGLSGALKAMEEENVIPVPVDTVTKGGAFNAGPALSRSCAEEAIEHICSQLREKANEYDAVMYCMHGGGCAEGIPDIDGYFLSRIREVIGEKKLMASLDLHANMSDEMISLSDGMFGIKTNPHVDYYEASYLAVKMLVKTLEGEISPKTYMKKLPLLISSATVNTVTGIGKEIKEYFEEYVKTHDLLDATFFYGFSATDTPDNTCCVVTVADGREAKAEAEELAQYVWSKRKEFFADLYNGEEALIAAEKAYKGGYVIINEGSDNPGSGCPGDGTHLLREMIKKNLDGTIMGPVLDARAAALCHKHKEGERFDITFGGNTDPAFGEPLCLKGVELKALCNGDYVCASPIYRGMTMHYGPSARLKYKNVEFIIVSNKMQVYDDRPFQMLGAFLENYKYVGLKSLNHFRAFFYGRADAIIAAETPSVFPADLTKLEYKNVKRPVYPLDKNI